MSKETLSNESIRFSRLACLLIIGCVLFISIFLSKNTNDNISNIILGEQALHSLYDFETLDEFDKNISIFETLVTPEVFNTMTANNSDRILGVYLKFKGQPSKVSIIESREGYIVYSLVSDSIERERTFLFTYSVDNDIISSINEAEIVPFMTTKGWQVDYTVEPYVDILPMLP